MKLFEVLAMPYLYTLLVRSVSASIFTQLGDQKPILSTTTAATDFVPATNVAPEAVSSINAIDAVPTQAPEILLSTIVTTTTTYYSETSHIILATYGVYAANITRTVPANNMTIDATILLTSVPHRTIWVTHLTFVAGPRVRYVPTASDMTTDARGDVHGIGFKPPTAAPPGPSQVMRPFCHGDKITNLTLSMPHRVQTGQPWIEKVTFQESFSGFYCHQTYSKGRINDCMRQFTTPLAGIKALVDLPALRETVLASTTTIAAPHWGITRGQSHRAIKENDCKDEESCLVHCESTSHWFKRPQFKLLVFGVPMIMMVILAFAFAHRLGRRGEKEKQGTIDKEATPSSTDGVFRGRLGARRKFEPPAAPRGQDTASSKSRTRPQEEPSGDEATMTSTASGTAAQDTASDDKSHREVAQATRNDDNTSVDIGDANRKSSTQSDRMVRDRYTTGSEAAENGSNQAFQRKKADH